MSAVLDRGLSRDRLLLASLGAAYAAFALTFRGPSERFWQRMTKTGASLGTLAVAAEPGLRRPRLRPSDVGFGLASAAGLYLVFRVGDRLARRLLRKGGEQIDAVYALERLRPRGELAFRLACVIGPAEELFWRGFVQRRLSERLGRWSGAAAAAALYAGAHVVTRNFTLTGAAGVAGAYWSALRAAEMSIPALVVSHVAWDIWIFLIAPTAKRGGVGGRRSDGDE